MYLIFHLHIVAQYTDFPLESIGTSHIDLLISLKLCVSPENTTIKGNTL